MLKLSEAIALGRTLVPVPRPNNLPNCAIGMALLAHDANHRFISTIEAVQQNYNYITTTYPWLKTLRKCPKCSMIIAEAATIWHVFDVHVFGVHNMTFDQMVDWIRSIEPAADAAVEPQPALAETEELVTVT